MVVTEEMQASGGGDRRNFDVLKDQRETGARERANATRLRAEESTLQSRIDGLDTQAGQFSNTRRTLRGQLDRLVDDAFNEQSLSNNVARNYERTRLHFNAQVTEYDRQVNDLITRINNFNGRVEQHMNTLQDERNSVRAFDYEEYPGPISQIYHLPSLNDAIIARQEVQQGHSQAESSTRR
jgi:chromosome segregation ATPase